MGAQHSKRSPERREVKAESTIESAPDLFGPANCKSCWYQSKGLVTCSNHYLCINCLTLLLTVSDRCPICYGKLPTTLSLTTTPSAPPYTP
ncbi:Z protein [Alxa virus]|uniref:RING finger protein Z n=1 Tax=Alxa virus TaxID=2847047 RepID=A0A2H4RDP1_9VIRU|nr:Z protein [Alxa virus]ATY47649.1 Z protein [Alxa virus]